MSALARPLILFGLILFGVAGCDGGDRRSPTALPLPGAPVWAYMPEIRVAVVLTPPAQALLRGRGGVIRVVESMDAWSTVAGLDYADSQDLIGIGSSFAETGHGGMLVVPPLKYDIRRLDFANGGKLNIHGDVEVRGADGNSATGLVCKGGIETGVFEGAARVKPVTCDVSP